MPHGRAVLRASHGLAPRRSSASTPHAALRDAPFDDGSESFDDGSESVTHRGRGATGTAGARLNAGRAPSRAPPYLTLRPSVDPPDMTDMQTDMEAKNA